MDVAAGWTVVDVPTPLLPECVPEIDAVPVSLEGQGGSIRHEDCRFPTLTIQTGRLLSSWNYPQFASPHTLAVVGKEKK